VWSPHATKGGSLLKSELPVTYLAQTQAHNPASAGAALHPVPITKRALDLGCLLLSFPLVVPVMLTLAAYIKLVSRGPIFFRQERIGRGQQRFEMLKFRSMRTDADPFTHAEHTTRLLLNNLPLTKLDAEGDPRLIPLGWLLRASGLDELPQLLNILQGKMSLVGPRPCTDYELAQLQPEHCMRFAVLPGLTGLWQVSGKNRTTFLEMIALDVRYARERSLWLDLEIMARTFPVLAGQILEMLNKRFRHPKL
jgi:exopolysaccharide production protein ExoY